MNQQADEGVAAEETDPGAIRSLDLIAPMDLPTDLRLAAMDAARLRPIISGFLSALDDADPVRRAHRVAGILDDLGPGETQVAAVGYTGIPESQDGVADFDDYFGVRRVADVDVAGALTRSLLQCAAAVLALCVRGSSLSETDVNGQLEGFASQAKLLGRIFGLGDLA